MEIKNTVAYTKNWIKSEAVSQKGDHAEMEEMREKIRKLEDLVQEVSIIRRDRKKIGIITLENN